MSSTTKSGKVSRLLSTRYSDQGRKKRSIEFYALKSFEKGRKERVLSEVKILQGLNDPGVIRFINWYETRNHFWIIYEYLAGGSLEAMIKEDAGMPETRLKPLVSMVLSGLIYLHSQNVAFVDFKPGNFVIDEYANLKFADFGLAVMIGEASEIEPKYSDFNFTAPEVLTRKSKPNFKSDIWGLGCLIFNLATGQIIFDYEQKLDNVGSVSKKELPPISEYSKEFINFLRGLLKLNPRDRSGWSEIITDPWVTELDTFKERLNSVQKIKEFATSQVSACRIEKSEGKLSVLSHQTSVSTQDQNPLNFGNLNASHNANSNIQLSPYVRPHQGSTTNSNSESLAEGNQSHRRDHHTTNSNVPGKQINQSNFFSKLTKSEDNSPINYSNPEPSIEQKPKSFNSSILHKQQDHVKVPDNPFFSQLDYDQPSDDNKLTQRKSLDRANSLVPKVEADTFVIPAPNSYTEADDIMSNQEEASFTKAEEVKQRLPPLLIKGAIFSKTAEIVFRNNCDNHSKIGREIALTRADQPISPIIFNNDIEALIFEFDDLMTPEIALVEPSNTNDEDTKYYLSVIYRYLNSDAHQGCKMAVLAHMLKIVPKENLANLIADSYIFDLLVHFLKVFKTRQMRIILCSLIGLILRYTTTTNLQINDSELVNIFLQIAEENADGTLKNRALAAMGEFLFYSATQADEQNQNWNFTGTYLARILIVMKMSRDVIAPMYLLKTVENITTLAKRNGAYFANEEFVKSALSAWSLHRSSKFSSFLISVLLNLIKLNPSLKSVLLDNKHFIHHVFELTNDKNLHLATSSVSLLSHLNILTVGSMPEYYEIAILNNWAKFIDCFHKNSLPLKTKAMTFIITLICSDSKFIELLSNYLKFSEIIDLLADILMEEAEHLDENSGVDSFSRTFVVLAEILKNHFVLFAHNFSEMMNTAHPSNQLEAGVPDMIFTFLKFMRMVLSSNFMKEKFIDDKEIILLFGCIDKISNLFATDNEELLDVYLNCIELFLRSDEVLHKNHFFFLNLLTNTLIPSIVNEPKAEVRELKFKIFMELCHKIWSEEDTQSNVPKGMAILEFCVQILQHKSFEMQSGALKVLRNLFERNLLSCGHVDSKRILKLFVDKMKDKDTAFISFHSFGVLFYILAEFSYHIYDYQKEGLFDLGVNYMLAHSDCEQFEEIFGFLNLYLEITHKLIKTRQYSQIIVLNGTVVSRLLKFLDVVAPKLGPIYLEDIINIVYYVLCILVNGTKSKALRIEGELDGSAFALSTLAYFASNSTLSGPVNKKFIKLNTLLKQF